MINVQKGTAHTLQQTDLVGNAKTSEAVVAGMICSIGADGYVIKGGATAALFGFAINNQTDGDSIESGKIGLYMLDGDSVIETDQAAAAITTTNYPIGTPIYPQTGNTGKVLASDSTINHLVGYVYGVRSVPTAQTVGGVNIQGSTALLAIKLAV